MEASEILKKAWEAVEAAGLPESMHEAAFREAVAILTAASGPAPATSEGHKPPAGGASPSPRRTALRTEAPAGKNAASTPVPDESSFFRELAHESGVAEADLRDVISLSSAGEVHVTPPTRQLGNNRAEQARTVTAIVGVARAIGLGESPVDASAVRSEVQRKRCFDSGNYASTVIGRLRGMNYGGSRAEIVLTSRWVDEFVSAINQARGQTTDDQ